MRGTLGWDGARQQESECGHKVKKGEARLASMAAYSSTVSSKIQGMQGECHPAHFLAAEPTASFMIPDGMEI